MNDPVSQASAGAPMPRRYGPALLGGALLLGCLVALVWQTARLLDLRRENAALRAATAGLDQLREENAELQRLRAVAQEAERAQKEQQELSRLRTEVAQLLAVARELPALRAEGQRLQAERTAAAAKAGVVAEVDPFAGEKGRAERIACISNLKQIGLAARMWAGDHKINGQDYILAADFRSMSNYLNTPKILICPADTARTRAGNWEEFDASSVSYEMLSPGGSENDPGIVYVRCPIHQNVGLTDGSAQQLDPALHRIEKVDGKFKIVRINAQP